MYASTNSYWIKENVFERVNFDKFNGMLASKLFGNSPQVACKNYKITPTKNGNPV
jgi:hypothetical protein